MTTLFFDLCPGPIIGITGSSGKTTTTGLIGHILKEAGRKVVVGGNIGDPMLDLLPGVDTETAVVLELSSFQLALLHRSPHIAVVTNISPNHLDRHGSMEAYVAAKQHILEYQSTDDYAVLHLQDPELQRMASSTPAEIRWFGSSAAPDRAAIVDTHESVLRLSNGRLEGFPVISVADVPLAGSHNLQNVAAAIATTDILDVAPQQMAAAIKTFKAPPHRLEVVRETHGVTYIDDSIATSPARSIVALQSLSQPIVLIAGGRDKHLPWEDFAHWASTRVRALVLIGEAAPLIDAAVRAALGHNSQLRPAMIRRCGSLEGAVAEASRLACPGDAVLLSPGCTSYDMFSDYEERGDAFARAVEALDAA